MKRKIISLFIAFALILMLSLTLIACTHQHFGLKLETDDNYHWHVCSECGEAYNKEQHNYVNFRCSCGMLDPKHTHDFSLQGAHCQCGMLDKNHKHVWEFAHNDETFHTLKCFCGETKKEFHIMSQDYLCDKENHWYCCKVCKAVKSNEKHSFYNNICLKCSYCDLTNGLEYKLNEDGKSYAVTSVKRLETSAHVEIPESYNGKPVTRLLNDAFDDWCDVENGASAVCKDYIKSISIPKTIKHIEEKTFYNFINLQKVILAEGVESIGDFAFASDYQLQNVNIPTSLKYVGNYAFDNCYRAEFEGEFNNLEEIGNSAFFNSKVTSAKLHNVKNIGSEAFADCSNLITLEINDNIQFVGEKAFYNSSIQTAILPAVALVGKIKNQNLQKVVVTSGTTLPDLVFSSCTNLTEVTLPNTITEISSSAFYACKNLTTLVLPKNICVIGENAFNNAGLIEITIPNKVRRLEYNTFFNCLSLKQVELSNGIEYIGDSCFYGCGNLQEIVLPDSVKEVGYKAFDRCINLTNLVVSESLIKFSVYSGGVGANAFDGSPLLEFNISNRLKYLGTNNNPYYLLVGATDEFISDKSTNKECVLHEDTKAAIDYALYNMPYVSSLSLPEGLKAIGNSAFFNLHHIESLVIPSSVIYIGDLAFAYCSGLQKYVISKDVEYVGKNAFPRQSNMVSVEEGHSKYINVNGGIVERDTGVLFFAGSHFEFPNDGSIKIIGESALADCYFNELIIPEGVTEIREYAFNCSRVKKVVLPKSLVSIEKNAFWQCHWLEEVVFAEGLKEIGSGAFDSCSKLTSVNLPQSLEEIDNNAFEYCNNLKGLSIVEGNEKYFSKGNCLIERDTRMLYIGCAGSVIPDDGSVTKIGENAFKFCNGLKNIALPSSITEIGYYAFYSCRNLEEIVLPNTLKIIDRCAFSGSGLKEIKIPNSVEYIGDWAFYDCANLIYVEIPASVKLVDRLAFGECSSLTSVSLHRETILKEGAFGNNYDTTNIYTINFNGTMEDWNNTVAYSNHKIGIKECVVHCTDGDVNYSDIID